MARRSAGGVEQGNVCAHRAGEIESSSDIHRNTTERDGFCLGQDLNQFHATARHTREEQFRGSDSLTRAAIPPVWPTL